ncbi:MAG: amidohydrolase [Sphingomonadales bacterium]
MAIAAAGLAGCATNIGDQPPAVAAKTPGAAAPEVTKPEVIKKNPYPSTYQPLPSVATIITNATVLTGTGESLEGASVMIRDGKIAAVGSDLDIPGDITVIDAAGKWVTPGIIDVHSHLGVYPSPGIDATGDGNEATSPNTAEVWAEHSVRPQDPGFTRALAGGVTAMQILPGSANLFGGRGVTLKNVPSRTMQGMKFPGAPQGLKMACGENPKRVYGGKKRSPSTAMGNVAGYRKAWARAVEYKRQWDKYYAKKENDAKPPKRDLRMDTLVGVLEGEILIHNHCYRGDEMAVMIDIAKEFGYRITAFHHAVEAYKVADILAGNGVCAAMWSDWWGFKLEAYDGIKENIAFVDNAGACAIVHSDSEVGIQRLNQEAAKARADGNAAGLDISRGHAIKWITLNPAKALGIAEDTGSLEIGKNADVVIWDRDPFSVYAKAETVFIDGAVMYDRHDPARQPIVDFELGQTFEGVR